MKMAFSAEFAFSSISVRDDNGQLANQSAIYIFGASSPSLGTYKGGFARNVVIFVFFYDIIIWSRKKTEMALFSTSLQLLSGGASELVIGRSQVRLLIL